MKKIPSKIRIDDIELRSVYSLKDEDREYEYEVVNGIKTRMEMRIVVL